MKILLENYYLLNLGYAVFISSALLAYLTRFNPEHPVAGAFRRMLLGFMGWAFFDFFIDHAGRIYPSETVFTFYRYLSFGFLFYQGAAVEFIITLMKKIGKRYLLIIYSPFVIFYIAGILLPGYVSAKNYGIDGGYPGVNAPWNTLVKIFIFSLIAFLLVKLLINALHDMDLPARKEKLMLFFGGFMTLTGIMISNLLLKRVWPGVPLFGSFFSSLTAIAAFFGMTFYGRVISERDFYHAVVKITPNGVVHLKNGRITWTNSSAAEILGYRGNDALLGVPIEKFFSDMEYSKSEINRFKGLIACGDLVNHEVILSRRNGDQVNCLVSGILYNEKDPLAGALIIIVDISPQKKAENEKEKLINDLQKALAEIKTLSGLLPICSYCKKVKDDSGYWQRIEEYIETRSDAKFSHGMCSDCQKKYHPELSHKMEEKK